jgi:hypothetical protein
MINADMKHHDYYLYGEQDMYGQPTLSDEVIGSVKMAIYSSNKSVTGDVNYVGGDYIGLTNDPNINDKYVIQYGNERLKVKYIVYAPRHMTQVFMSRM